MTDYTRMNTEHGPLTMTKEREEELRYKPRGGRTNELREVFSELDAERAISQELLCGLKQLLPYREHRPGCEVNQTDFCNCGMAIASAQANAAISKTKAGVLPAEERDAPHE